MDSSSSRQMFGYVFWFAVVLLVQVGAQYIGQSDSDALRWSMLFWQALHSWPHRVVGKGCENIALRKWSWTTPLRWEYHMGLQFFKTKHEWKSHEIPNLMLWSVCCYLPIMPLLFFFAFCYRHYTATTSSPRCWPFFSRVKTQRPPPWPRVCASWRHLPDAKPNCCRNRDIHRHPRVPLIHWGSGVGGLEGPQCFFISYVFMRVP